MKLLMHMCCGPCAIYPVNRVKAQGIDVTGLYFNPNIHPRSEFDKRKNALKEVAKQLNFNLIIKEEYDEDFWYQLENEKKTSKNSRCAVCYDVRLNNTFSYAKENGFQAVTTSLLVSPYQNHDLIILISKKYGEKYKIDFHYEDYRLGYREGQKIAKEMKIYCQKYCGCILSLKERFREISEKLK